MVVTCMFVNSFIPDITHPFAHVTTMALGVLAGTLIPEKHTYEFVNAHVPAGIVATLPLNVPSKNTMIGPSTVPAAENSEAHVVKTLALGVPPG